MLDEEGISHDLDTDAYRQLSERSPGEANTHLSAQVDRLVASMTAEEVYHKAQAKGLLWASVRRYPEENLNDPHFQARGTFQAIHQPQIGPDLYFPVSAATDGHNRLTDFKRAAPRLGQRTREVLSALGFNEAELGRLAAQGVIQARGRGGRPGGRDHALPESPDCRAGKLGADSSQIRTTGCTATSGRAVGGGGPPQKGIPSLHGGEVNKSVKTPYLWLGRVRY